MILIVFAIQGFPSPCYYFFYRCGLIDVIHGSETFIDQLTLFHPDRDLAEENENKITLMAEMYYICIERAVVRPRTISIQRVAEVPLKSKSETI